MHGTEAEAEALHVEKEQMRVLKNKIALDVLPKAQDKLDYLRLQIEMR